MSEVIFPTKLVRELNLIMFILLIPPSIVTILVIIRISIPIPTLMIVSSLFLILSALLVPLLV